jgi:hypothetical protein
MKVEIFVEWREREQFVMFSKAVFLFVPHEPLRSSPETWVPGSLIKS